MHPPKPTRRAAPAHSPRRLAVELPAEGKSGWPLETRTENHTGFEALTATQLRVSQRLSIRWVLSIDEWLETRKRPGTRRARPLLVAQERTRTSMAFQPLDPESSVSTNSTTWALPTAARRRIRLSAPDRSVKQKCGRPDTLPLLGRIVFDPKLHQRHTLDTDASTVDRPVRDPLDARIGRNRLCLPRSRPPQRG